MAKPRPWPAAATRALPDLFKGCAQGWAMRRELWNRPPAPASSASLGVSFSNQRSSGTPPSLVNLLAAVGWASGLVFNNRPCSMIFFFSGGGGGGVLGTPKILQEYIRSGRIRFKTACKFWSGFGVGLGGFGPWPAAAARGCCRLPAAASASTPKEHAPVAKVQAPQPPYQGHGARLKPLNKVLECGMPWRCVFSCVFSVLRVCKSFS